MKYIKTFESKNKKHKYKVGDWVLLNIEEDNFIDTGEIIDLVSLVGRSDEDFAYTVDIFSKLPEYLSYMEGDTESTCNVEECEIERRLNKKEIEKAKLKKYTDKYNL